MVLLDAFAQPISLSQKSRLFLVAWWVGEDTDFIVIKIIKLESWPWHHIMKIDANFFQVIWWKGKTLFKNEINEWITRDSINHNNNINNICEMSTKISHYFNIHLYLSLSYLLPHYHLNVITSEYSFMYGGTSTFPL